ncbi:MAG: hypothetical protein AB7J40_02065 [Candidatus Altimarinota bacterium]
MISLWWKKPTIIIGILGLLLTALGLFVSSGYSQQASIVGDNNSVQQINGDNNIIQNVDFGDQENKLWKDASVPLQRFVTELNNRDFGGARNLLDRVIKNEPVFSEKELEHFMNHVDGKVTIRDLAYDSSINKDEEFVSSRGFYFFLRYLKNDRQVIEKWRATSVKKNQEENIWLIGELRCEDKKCENGSLLAETNF